MLDNANLHPLYQSEIFKSLDIEITKLSSIDDTLKLLESFHEQIHKFNEFLIES